MQSPKKTLPIQNPDQPNLEHLDLSSIKLEENSSPDMTKWIILSALTLLGLFIVLFPNTEYYRYSSNAQSYFFGISTCAVAIGIFGGRWLWAWLEQTHSSQTPSLTVEASPKTYSPLQRWLTLLTATCGLITIVYFSDKISLTPGQAQTSDWWLISMGGLASAGLAGRWLILQANRPRAPITSSPTPRAPKWLKWLTLSLLAAGGIFALFGRKLLNRTETIFDASIFGSTGLLVGTFGAIWLAKRFDEWEKKIRTNDDIP